MSIYSFIDENNIVNGGVLWGNIKKYQVRAYITVNGTTYYGELSDEVKATTSCAMPKYRLTSDKKGQITVNWKPVAGAKRYVVFYKTEKYGTWKVLTGSNTTKTTFIKKNLVSGKRYYFYVRAIKDYKGTEVKSGAYFKNKASR